MINNLLLPLSVLPSLMQVACFSNEITRMSLQELYETPIADIPEEVHVTDMLDPYGRVTLDALVYILEKIPEK